MFALVVKSDVATDSVAMGTWICAYMDKSARLHKPSGASGQGNLRPVGRMTIPCLVGSGLDLEENPIASQHDCIQQRIKNAATVKHSMGLRRISNPHVLRHAFADGPHMARDPTMQH